MKTPASRFPGPLNVQSAPQAAAQALREAIISGELKGGDRILEQKWSAQLGIGQPTLREALREPVDVICQMDADLSHDPTQLPALIAAADESDVVIGSRYVPGGRIANWPLRRRLLSRFANAYIRSVTRLVVRDCT